MGGYAGVQPTDNSVKSLLFSAHVLEVSTKTVLMVDCLPYVAAVVSCIGLFVEIHIEVLALVILNVLHVPNTR